MEEETLLERLEALEVRVRDQAEILTAMEEVGGQVSLLAGQLADVQVKLTAQEATEQPGYNPFPSIRWWALTREEREASKHKIRGFYTEILGPMYGHLGGMPPCWESHQLVWTIGDWLTELWSYLYLSPRRPPAMLSGQAELTIRILPAVADLIRRECKNCDHELGITPRVAS